MNDVVIREIAEKLAQQQLLASWPWLLAVLAISVVVGAVAIYSSSYLRKRAETFASRADLDEVLRLVRATTEATEEVKSSIAHSDWASRELRTLRRTKLEDLLLAIYELQAWERSYRDFRVHGKGSDPGPSQMGRISLLATLYFPELLLEIKKLAHVHYSFHKNQLEAEASIRAAGTDASLRSQAVEFSTTQSRDLYGQHLALVGQIEKISQSLMKDILGA